MIITSEQHEKYFDGYIVVDCAVRSKEIIYFSLCEDISQMDDEEDLDEIWPNRRIVYYVGTAPKELQWGNVNFDSSDDYHLCIARLPQEKLIAIEDEGQVYSLGSGSQGMEKRLGDWIEGGILRGAVIRCRTIDGYPYLAGGGRTVAMRKDRNNFVPLMQGLPYDDDEDFEVAGFEDIDGFSSNDIYCVGGEGDVWHFDGTAWSQVQFPSNIDLNSVCCAGDGEVYISGYQGTTFKGRGNKWKQIYKGEMTIPFKDLVWHGDRVWCTNDYGLWQILDGKLSVAQVDSEITVGSGHLSSYAGILLLAGHSGAAYNENGIWHKIF
ncbi:hypothetical protein [Massilia aquatica]|uniref:Uncharacterized protein n=1 Tax=Massilia aquatica TaxID=2609000 RepID=A0ABX0M9J4_9BURK|nr:hypothetical protein [Massilia aquatica]NHZ40892.1 hypothetical protein [Massilia aquatica]